jgi:hypothetical protein
MYKRTNEVISNLVIWRIYDAGASKANKPAANGTEIASARMLYFSKSAKTVQSGAKANQTHRHDGVWAGRPCL